MKIIDITNNDIDLYVKNGNVLVDFYADWCGPCKMIHAELEKVKDEVQILKVNVDKNRELSKEYGVMSIPTLIYFDQNGSINKSIGFMNSDDILDFIKG